MALARLSVKVGKAGKAMAHAAYIAREGKYAKYLEKGERLEATESGNMPDWAKHQPQAFWLADDAFERSNGTAYREMENALPREMTPAQRIDLVREWVARELGDQHAYQWAIHVPKAADGGEQPHVHLMFSERRVDGIERDPQQYFKRYNSKAPEKGGAKKGYGPSAGQTLSDAERKAELKALRSRWADMTNRHLEKGGYAERIDMRSYAAQGLVKDAEAKQLPSQWRDPAAKAKVLEFRGARVELAKAEQEVTRWVPNLARLIDLEAERARRGLPKAATPPLPPERAPRRPAVRLPDNPLPVYARNPRKMATLADISARGKRLFGPLKTPEGKDQANDQVEGLTITVRPEVLAAWNPAAEAKAAKAGVWQPGKRTNKQTDKQADDDAARSGGWNPAGMNRPAIERVAIEVTLPKVEAEPRPLPAAVSVAPAQPEKAPAPARPPAVERPADSSLAGLTGSARIRARAAMLRGGDSQPAEPPDAAPLGFRERMAATMGELSRTLNGLLPVEPAPAAQAEAVPPPEPIERPAAAPIESPAGEPIVPGAAAIEAKRPSAARVELERLKAELRPVDELVAKLPAYRKALQARDAHRAEVDEAREVQAEIPEQVAQWRREHPVRATLHDRGIKKSPELENAERLLDRTAMALRSEYVVASEHESKVYRAKWEGEREVYAQQRPVVERIAALEAIVAAEDAPARSAAAPRVSRPAYRPQRDYRPDWGRDEPGMD